MKPIQRLEWYLKHNKIKFSAVEKEIGLATGYLSKQIKNLGSIGSDILEKICKTYPGLNPTWLLTGQGHYDATLVTTTAAVSGRSVTVNDFVADKLKFINDLGLADKEKLELCKIYAEKLLLQIELLEKELASYQSRPKYQ